ncbi:MAG: DUF2059 domain-containing protein, partial [Rhodobacterales bacterium]|nr:DUF2059 domain-containing protein [Rhodobacterales bacterium]
VVTLGLPLSGVSPALAQSADPSVPASSTGTAPVSAEITALARALRLDDLFAVLRDEGLASGARIEADMFPSGFGSGWATALDRIYTLSALRAGFDRELAVELGEDPESLAEMQAFFASDLGARIVGLEIAARRAFLDPAAEDAARVAADKRRTARDPRADQIDRFITAGDLLEMNVAGALTGNLAFMTGLDESGANGPALPQDELMQNVWGQEAQIREDTAVWMQAYLGLAYAPLTDAELDTYITFWESPAGQRLNAALFLAFDSVFRQVSHDLGREAGLAMLGLDI